MLVDFNSAPKTPKKCSTSLERKNYHMTIKDESFDDSELSMAQVINQMKQANKKLRKAPPIVSSSELGTPLSLSRVGFWERRQRDSSS
jgi:hypothetical protein